MDCLKGEFEVEPGEGGSRCEYLKEKGIVTYLIVVPKQPLRNGINGVVSGGAGAGAAGEPGRASSHRLLPAEAVPHLVPRRLPAARQHQGAQRQPQRGLRQPRRVRRARRQGEGHLGERGGGWRGRAQGKHPLQRLICVFWGG